MMRLELLRPHFHDHVHAGVDRLQHFLKSSAFHQAHDLVRAYVAKSRASIAHLDARQSNIAWSPESGARIVDWSWASAAPRGADRTMFIIDLFKAGFDVHPLVNHHLEPGYGLLQMGHWLARGTQPSSPGDNNVRFHQLASAASAATLML